MNDLASYRLDAAHERLAAAKDNIDATHTGFVIFRDGEYPVLRHAAYTKYVLDIPLKEYLEGRRGKLPGIALFEFLKP